MRCSVYYVLCWNSYFGLFDLHFCSLTLLLYLTSLAFVISALSSCTIPFISSWTFLFLRMNLRIMLIFSTYTCCGSFQSYLYIFGWCVWASFDLLSPLFIWFVVPSCGSMTWSIFDVFQKGRNRRKWFPSPCFLIVPEPQYNKGWSNGAWMSHPYRPTRLENEIERAEACLLLWHCLKQNGRNENVADGGGAGQNTIRMSLFGRIS